MGTRADFYIGRGKGSEWLGSIAFDGYPSGIAEALRSAETEEDYRAQLKTFSERRKDWTAPTDGWPWPWEDSGTTDYAYAFDGDEVFGSCFGAAWFPAWEEEPEEHPDGPKVTFPDMTSRQNVTLGKRSGLIIISNGASAEEEG